MCGAAPSGSVVILACVGGFVDSHVALALQNDKDWDAKYNDKTALEIAEIRGNTEAAQVIRAGTLATTQMQYISLAPSGSI